MAAKSKTIGAGVHGRHEHEVRRVGQRLGRAGYRHPAVFQGLAQHLQHVLLELRQFIQEQDPSVGEGDLAGPGADPAADEPGVADGVVRRAERATHHERGLAREHSGHGVNLGDFQGLVEGERRQNRGDALGKHGLAAARRAHEEHHWPL